MLIHPKHLYFHYLKLKLEPRRIINTTLNNLSLELANTLHKHSCFYKLMGQLRTDSNCYVYSWCSVSLKGLMCY